MMIKTALLLVLTLVLVCIDQAKCLSAIHATNTSLTSEGDSSNIVATSQSQKRSIEAAKTQQQLQQQQQSTAVTTITASQEVFRQISPSVVSIIIPSHGDGGSGIIIDAISGFVLTARHVVANVIANNNNDNIYVILVDKRCYRATITGYDDIIDIAILQLRLDDMISRGKIQDQILPQLSAKIHWYDYDLPSSIQWDKPLPVAAATLLGNSTALEIGTPVLSIGFVLEYGLEVTSGVVSGFYSDHDLTSLNVRSIMTDTDVFDGFSGGPLVNVDSGMVVGINRLTIVSTSSYDLKHHRHRGYYYHQKERNIAIPIDNVKEILPNLKEKGSISSSINHHGTIGIHLRTVTCDMPAFNGMVECGAEIIKIDKHSPAMKCKKPKKLHVGDVIIEINSVEIATATQARKIIDQAVIGKVRTFLQTV